MVVYAHLVNDEAQPVLVVQVSFNNAPIEFLRWFVGASLQNELVDREREETSLIRVDALEIFLPDFVVFVDGV